MSLEARTFFSFFLHDADLRLSFPHSVYVGKLRNRLKVAIAEFRGQLSESESFVCVSPLFFFAGSSLTSFPSLSLFSQWTSKSSSFSLTSITPTSFDS